MERMESNVIAITSDQLMCESFSIPFHLIFICPFKPVFKNWFFNILQSMTGKWCDVHNLMTDIKHITRFAFFQ